MPLVYVLHVALEDISPPIWRRLLVPCALSLKRTHTVIQRAMGWQNQHLYEFTKLCSVAPAVGAKLLYEYDFGDGWQHDVVVEAIVAPEDGVRYPTCVAGKRACPPEDCGGPYGYIELLKALADPGHPEHEDKVDWIGDDFDPEAFNLDEVNALLRRIR